MRRLFLTGASLLFALVILMVSIVRTAQPRVLAVVDEVKEEIVEGVEDVDVEGVEVIDEATGAADYYLAYPGILPDHPLYFLKMIRDRVRLWVTRDPVKRIELKLLYADKRVGAAKALSEGNKNELAVTVATKAENYMSQVIGELNKLGEQGQELPELWEKVHGATAKHLEVLGEILERVPDQTKSSVEKAMEVSRLGQEKATEVLGRDRVEQQERIREGEEIGEGEGERIREEEEVRLREEAGKEMNQNQEQRGKEGE